MLIQKVKMKKVKKKLSRSKQQLLPFTVCDNFSATRKFENVKRPNLMPVKMKTSASNAK